MTPPAAAVAPRTRTKRATPPPRRVSGPVRGKSRSASTPVAAPPLALRLGGAVHGLAEHHFLERLIRGRAWIGIVGVGLIGIVFMQVSMLRMNAGIGQAVEKSSLLERQNSAMRAAISDLSAGDRIAAEATRLGLILPEGTPRFLDARGVDPRRALTSMTPPGEGIVPMSTEPAVDIVEPAPTTPILGASGVAATDTPATETPETPATTQAAPTSATPTPTAAPVSSAAPTAARVQTAAPPPTDGTGGVDAPGQAG